MEPVKFVGANSIYTGPGCGELPALEAKDENYGLSVTSCWRPSAEELEILNAGGCVCLTVAGGQPPVLLWVQQVNIVD